MAYVILMKSVKPRSLGCTFILVKAYLFRCAETRFYFKSASKVWISSEAVFGVTSEKAEATSLSENLRVSLSASVILSNMLRERP